MAFHFQPQADSSDEDEQVDLSSWQTGAKPPRRPSPPAAAMAVMDELADEDDGEVEDPLAAFRSGGQGTEPGDDDEDIEEEDGTTDQDGKIAIDDSATPDITSSGKESKTRKRKGTTPFVSPGFTSINNPAPNSPPSSEEDALDATELAPRRGRSGTGRTPVKRKARLVPIIPRVQLDSDEEAEIIDFTAGGDVVRRVKKESRGRGGDLLYKVEFEDRHVEEVRSFDFFSTSLITLFFLFWREFHSELLTLHIWLVNYWSFAMHYSHYGLNFGSLVPVHMTLTCLIRRRHGPTYKTLSYHSQRSENHPAARKLQYKTDWWTFRSHLTSCFSTRTAKKH